MTAASRAGPAPIEGPILAVDTAGHACSVALVWPDGDRPPIATIEPMARGHAERLMPAITDLMGRGGVRYSELSVLAVTIGPGAFTGLRIGMAAINGIALARSIPVVGLSTLEACAARVRAVPPTGEGGTPGAVALATPCDGWQDTVILAVVDSRRDAPYAQLFAPDGRPLSPVVQAPPARLVDQLRSQYPSDTGPVIVGDSPALEAVARAWPGARVCGGAQPIDPIALALLAHARRAEAGAQAPAPLYVRPPDAVEARPGRGHLPAASR